MKWTILLVGLVLLLVVVSSGCVEKETPAEITGTETVSPTPTTERQEEPDPFIRSQGNLVASYKYSSGVLDGAEVFTGVVNRGGAGLVEVIFKAENRTIKREFIYLESGEEELVSAFVPASILRYRFGRDVEITATASPVQLDINSLIRDLDQKDLKVRKKAAVILGVVREKRAVEPLIKALDDDESVMRTVAAEALGKIGEPAVEPLIQALKNKDWIVRDNAAEALGKIGDARAVEPLILASKDENSRVRGEAAEALGEIGDARAVEPLILALKDENKFVRLYAVEALGKIGDARAVEPLTQSLKDEDKYVREYAAEALEKIRGLG